MPNKPKVVHLHREPLTITVSGPAKSGKTWMAFIIAALLDQEKISVAGKCIAGGDVLDINKDECATRYAKVSTRSGRKAVAAKIKFGTITIKTMQTGRVAEAKS